LYAIELGYCRTEPLTSSSKRAAVFFATLATAVAVALLGRAQPQLAPGSASHTSSGANHNLIVLDPAHGGADNGASLGGQVVEKDVTLALAGQLRTALTAAGFSVVSTRDGELPAPLTADQRAEIANRARPLACILLHASAAGSGVHLYTSTLRQADAGVEDDPDSFTATPWDEAQAAFVAQSLSLASSLNSALSKAGLPALNGHAALRPLDNLSCPAVAIELAPLLVAGADPTPTSDAGYQQRVAASVAATLRVWRDQAVQGSVP
jgi:N-acetylmuramoyl-L-alanine amidase